MAVPGYGSNEDLYRIFNSPESLNELPELLGYINNYKVGLSNKIDEEIEQFKSTSSSELGDDVVELIQLMKQVRENALGTKSLIEGMTKSIQDLDRYKKNLVLSMTILKRLQMLINANNTLMNIIPTRDYKEILSLLSVIKELLIFFKPYKSIDEINQLNLMVINTQNKLIDDIFIDFEEFSKIPNPDGKKLVYGCEILELIDLKYKDKLLNWFYNMQLKELKTIFNNLDEAGSLDNLNRRYIYFSNTLKIVRSKFLDIFPKEWNIDLELSKLFCKLTKQDLINLISASSRINSKLLLDNLTTTLEFERSMNETFKNDQFDHIISSVFEPYLIIWVNDQESTLNSKLMEFMAISQLPTEFNVQTNSDLLTVLKVNNVPNIATSCTELFKTFQKILTQILKLSNGEILVDLNKLFVKYLYEFHNKILYPLVPKSEEDFTRSSGTDSIKYLTMLLNTGDYMINNIDDITEKFQTLIKDEFKNKLPLADNVKDVYYNLIAKSINGLLTKIANDSKFCWREFSNINWNSLEFINDVSGYLNDLKQILVEQNLRLILPLIIRDSYVRNFNDKLVELLLNSYADNLRYVKPLNVLSVEQLLLDVTSLKDLALNFPLYADPNLDETKSHQSKSYQKFVNNQFHQLESLLKVLLVPSEPMEGLIESYFELIGDKSIRNFMKVLNLKDIDKVIQQKYIDNFKIQLNIDDGGTLISHSTLLSNLDDEDDDHRDRERDRDGSTISTINSPTPEFKSPKILPTKMNNLEKNLRELAINGETHVSKFNENFKNFGKFFRKDNID
ncbi:protein required for protein sorting at the late Golgi [Scheffersomyces amazonensis]|uniref:protein required for protein sorting at the late Golgi n=1 Tax=Scheffersomyces amazonensis TaxID=1078765 RepID=UPI00315DAA7E